MAFTFIPRIITFFRDDQRTVNLAPRPLPRIDIRPGLGGVDYVITHPNGSMVTCATSEEAEREAGPLTAERIARAWFGHAYRSGRAAVLAGKTLVDNPYSSDSRDARAWKLGFVLLGEQTK